MKFYKIDDQIVISKKSLSMGTELIPNTVDAAQEKHVPMVYGLQNSYTVKVGSVEHPMLDSHYIEWILLETENGYQIRYLKPRIMPQITFLINDRVIAAYEYCNLHGLWKAEV